MRTVHATERDNARDDGERANVTVRLRSEVQTRPEREGTRGQREGMRVIAVAVRGSEHARLRRSRAAHLPVVFFAVNIRHLALTLPFAVIELAFVFDIIVA